jgi:hypothetical protein
MHASSLSEEIAVNFLKRKVAPRFCGALANSVTSSSQKKKVPVRIERTYNYINHDRDTKLDG